MLIGGNEEEESGGLDGAGQQPPAGSKAQAQGQQRQEAQVKVRAQQQGQAQVQAKVQVAQAQAQGLRRQQPQPPVEELEELEEPDEPQEPEESEEPLNESFFQQHQQHFEPYPTKDRGVHQEEDDDDEENFPRMPMPATLGPNKFSAEWGSPARAAPTVSSSSSVSPQTDSKPSSRQSPAGPSDNAEDLRENVTALAHGTLFLVQATGLLDKRADDVEIQLCAYDDFIYELRVADLTRRKLVLTVPLNNSLQAKFDRESMSWMTFHVDLILHWRLAFHDGEEALMFKTALARAMVEASRKVPFAKIFSGKEDEQWLVSGYDSPDERPKQAHRDDDEEEELEFEEETHAEHEQPDLGDGKEYNSNLNVGAAENRAYVFRGPTLGVFTHNQNEELEYVGKVDHIKGLDDAEIAPITTMLHDRDRKMLMLHPARQDTVAEMDIERAQVVNEWRSKEDFRVRHVAPRFKYAQLSGEQTFAAVSANGLYYMDPRLRSQDKMTAFKHNSDGKYSCVATTGEGHVVVGSESGDIRLFSAADPKKGAFVGAKTKLPGLGDAVTGIDVTEDGRWILATTEHYLLVVATTVLEDDKDRTGFTARTPAAKRNKPIKLQLRYEDVIKFNITEVSFTPATFNTGKDQHEHWIVTSTGPYIITWDFRKVRLGFRDAYQIKRTSGTVVQSKFRYNKEDQVVVNLPNDVYLEKRKHKH